MCHCGSIWTHISNSERPTKHASYWKPAALDYKSQNTNFEHWSMARQSEGDRKNENDIQWQGNVT